MPRVTAGASEVSASRTPPVFWHSLHERVYRAAEHCFTEARRSDPWIAGRFVQEEREPTWLIAERSMFDVRPCSAVVLALALRAAVRAQCGSPSERHWERNLWRVN